ncbi:MarR family winged helix-turn-helix transcriptional regulator [Dactylosporangium sp. CA-152071]|uniref:MarR family winged helix-turn-helix transcriptional regulator n=1 Tax=Dactylosporangium sp. CA-152071 TaxID=3239933 RepID=UPI003D8A6FD5
MILELQRATHATLQVLSARLADLDLTPSELNALGNLGLTASGDRPEEGAGRTVSELGAATGTRPTTLTGVLDRLERRGLITRAAHPGDRRAVLVTLTAEGAATAAVITRAIADLEREALADLPAGTVEAALTVLRALT